jgi:zinc protease
MDCGDSYIVTSLKKAQVSPKVFAIFVPLYGYNPEMLKRTQTLFFTVLFFVLTCLSTALAEPAQVAASLSDPIPVEREITIGKLPNGLRYYVRANRKPEKRAELRLVVKAGSVLEDDDQQGLAHFVEHMAFNGTAHFPKNEIVKFIESLGMRFGADLNAYTSFDETVYILQVPTDKPEVMDKALLVLEDWAHNVSFETEEINKERGVVMEEWRLRRGAGARTTDKLFPILLKGSRYADRIPIGKPEIIQNFKPDTLKKFYKDWYRPELMAVVAVGDFDKAAVENLIKTHFGAIPATPSPRPRPTPDVPDHDGSVYAITTDKEMTTTSVSVENIMPARKQGTVGSYRTDIVESLFSEMLSARFAEIAQKPDAPFLGAGAGKGPFITPTKDEAELSARVKEDGIEKGLDALLTEVERVRRFGFTATELDRARQNRLRSYERLVIEDQNRQSNSRADEYIRNFLTDEPLPGAELEQAFHQRFLPQITLDEINALAKQWFTENNRFVVVTAPDKPGLVIPDESKLAAVIKAAPDKDLKGYVDNVTSAALLDSVPSAGSVVKTTTKDAVGITEWELSNGVKVVLKPTTFRADEIQFRATSPGGTSLASDADYVAANSATQVITAGGVGKFNAVDLRRMLTGKVASARPTISELEEGLSGSSSRQDVETMFQLIYLAFTAPRADPTAFGVQAAQMKSMLANQTAVPEFAFSQVLSSTLSQNHLRRRFLTPEMIDQWDLAKSLAFYKDRFADASDFTFVFVGSFDEAMMKPLVERYLATLPSIGRKETWKDVGVRRPTGVIEKKVEKGIEPKSQTALVFSGPFTYDQTQRVAIRALAQVLQARLLETIREELGGTYSITASQSYSKIPVSEYSFTIQFGSDPQRVDALVKRVMEEVERLKTNGPNEQQVNDVKQTLLREFETNSKLNAYLLTQISLKYQFGEDVAGLWDIPEFYKKLDAATIQQAARTYLKGDNEVRVTLVPEKK